MSLTLEEFEKIASSQQKQLLEKIIHLIHEEQEYVDLLNNARKPFVEAVYQEKSRWGFNFSQIADLVIDQEIIPSADKVTQPYQEKLSIIRTELSTYFKRAVQEGLDNLGFIQRHYSNVVGEPFPSTK